MITSRSIHIVASGIHCTLAHIASWPEGLVGFFSGKKKKHSVIYMYITSLYMYIHHVSSLSIYLLMNTGCFYVLTIVNSAAMNT